MTKAHEQALRGQIIEVGRPGSVLRDFHMLLASVGSEGVEASGKYNLLPIDAIADLDQRLTRPLNLQLQRPQLRSHPYLQGLHLLLRASCLTRVEQAGARTRLVVDPEMLAAWQQLNFTEQYFTLLEAWLRFGRPEMIGERGRWFNGPLGDILVAWTNLTPQGVRFDLKRPQQVYVYGIGRDFYLLALLDLFGLLAIEYPRVAVQPWCPAGLERVPFGDAVLTLLGGQLFSPSRRGDDEADGLAAPHFGNWQALFTPYFPEWRQNLTLPSTAARKGVFVFRVSLGKVWRRIAIPDSATLDELVGWILRSVNFDFDHLYALVCRDRFGGTTHIHHPAMDEPPWADEVAIGELPLEVGQSMTLVYDFGDNWKFQVKLERIDPPGKKKAARILEKHGKSPEQYPELDW
jgi:hypothetical protein